MDTRPDFPQQLRGAQKVFRGRECGFLYASGWRFFGMFTITNPFKQRLNVTAPPPATAPHPLQPPKPRDIAAF